MSSKNRNIKNIIEGYAIYVWLIFILTPLFIECHRECNNPPVTSYKDHCGRIEGKNLRDGPKREIKQEPQIRSYKHLYHTSKESGIILKKGNRTIKTGMTSEEIINQLSLDYQDLYDYYGGAEELY